MKTSKSTTGKTTTALTSLTLMLAATLFVASCKKEELAQPTTMSTETDNAKFIKQQQSAAAEMAFSAIRIDHVSHGSKAADYSVSFNANGTGLYEGRKNVNLIGKKSFLVSKKTLLKINGLYLTRNATLSEHIKMDSEKVMFHTYNLTAIFKYGEQPTELNFDYDGKPLNTVAFRTAVEEALGIALLTKGNVAFDVASIDK